MPTKTAELLCSVCGSELVLQTAGRGEGSLYACVNDDSPERSEGWLKHYRQSEVTIVHNLREKVEFPVAR